MRLSVFIPSLGGGGAERATVRVTTALVERGHAVRILTARDEQAANNAPDARVEVTSFGRRHARGAILALARHLRTERPDALLTVMDPASAAGLVAARISRTQVPVVTAFHNDVAAASRHSRHPYARVRPAVARAIVRHADRVVVVSEGARATLADLAGRDAGRIALIYNPTIDQRLFELAKEPIADCAPDPERTILAVGRLAPAKGYDVLIEAFAVLASAHADLQLLILGEGPQRAALEHLAVQRNVGERVHLPGYVANPYPYMQRCAVMALSSRWEGLPTVLVEAGALGATIVATDCPSGPAELLAGRDQATLVPVDDPAALAAAIEAALARERAAPSRDWLEHTTRESASRYEALLLDVVRSSS